MNNEGNNSTVNLSDENDAPLMTDEKRVELDWIDLKFYTEDGGEG